MVSGRGSESERTSGVEFEQALDRAELLLGGVREMRSSIRRLTVTQISTVGVASVVVVIVLTVDRLSAALALALALMAAIATVVFMLAVQIMLVRPLRPQIRRDERAMIELVDMLRELTPHLSRREQWSDVRRLLVRTRLERFPVGVKDAK